MHCKNKNTNDLPYISQFKAPTDHIINMAKWGPLDQSIFYGTNRGRLIQVDFETTKAIRTRDVHKNEIFSLTFSPDFTMLFTCSRDGTTKMLHPETFDEVRTFNHEFPCRAADISPLYMAEEN